MADNKQAFQAGQAAGRTEVSFFLQTLSTVYEKIYRYCSTDFLEPNLIYFEALIKQDIIISF